MGMSYTNSRCHHKVKHRATRRWAGTKTRAVCSCEKLDGVVYYEVSWSMYMMPRIYPVESKWSRFVDLKDEVCARYSIFPTHPTSIYILFLLSPDPRMFCRRWLTFMIFWLLFSVLLSVLLRWLIWFAIVYGESVMHREIRLIGLLMTAGFYSHGWLCMPNISYDAFLKINERSGLMFM